MLVHIESFQIGKEKKGFSTYDTVYIKDNNSVAVSSGSVGNSIYIIDIDSQKVMTTISMGSNISTCHGMCVGVCIEKFVCKCSYVIYS
jgi:hypothetical protein